jgi:L-malate glycosyltransferase
MRRRILLMSYCLDLGGSERQLTEVARSLDPAAFEVHVGCEKPGGLRTAELEAAGIPIVAFPMTSFFSVNAIRQAARLMGYIRQHRIDLVHAFDVPMDVFAVPAARLSGRPVVLSSQRAHRSLTSGPRLRILRMADRIVDGVVVNCEFIRRHLIEDEGVKPSKIHLCYNGLNLDAFPFHEPRGTNVGIICALRPEKNLPLLIRAFAQVIREVPAAKLLIVGSGPMLPGLEALVAELHLARAMKFEPATRDVADRLREIDVFVLPSTTEALSNALMEAMACGCAVVASDVGGNPELVGRQERGLLFSSGDVNGLATAVVKLLRDEELRCSFGRAARAFMKSNFSIERSAKRMGEIYEGFLNKRSFNS